MIRIITKTVSSTPDGTGLPPEYASFDIDIPDLEAHLREVGGSYTVREVVGAIIVHPPSESEPKP